MEQIQVKYYKNPKKRIPKYMEKVAEDLCNEFKIGIPLHQLYEEGKGINLYFYVELEDGVWLKDELLPSNKKEWTVWMRAYVQAFTSARSKYRNSEGWLFREVSDEYMINDFKKSAKALGYKIKDLKIKKVETYRHYQDECYSYDGSSIGNARGIGGHSRKFIIRHKMFGKILLGSTGVRGKEYHMFFNKEPSDKQVKFGTKMNILKDGKYKDRSLVDYANKYN